MAFDTPLDEGSKETRYAKIEVLREGRVSGFHQKYHEAVRSDANLNPKS